MLSERQPTRTVVVKADGLFDADKNIVMQLLDLEIAKTGRVNPSMVPTSGFGGIFAVSEEGVLTTAWSHPIPGVGVQKAVTAVTADALVRVEGEANQVLVTTDGHALEGFSFSSQLREAVARQEAALEAALEKAAKED